jgi:hypothetical protein
VAVREIWIQIENHAWDVAPNDIDRMTGLRVRHGRRGVAHRQEAVSPVTGVTRQRTMFKPLAEDALILRRYTENWGAATTARSIRGTSTSPAPPTTERSEAALWAQVNVTGPKQGDRVPPPIDDEMAIFTRISAHQGARVARGDQARHPRVALHHFSHFFYGAWSRRAGEAPARGFATADVTPTAPHGDYMLFVVNNVGVPSAGRWIYLH